MATQTRTTGFYGTDDATYYVTPKGVTYASASDRDDIRKVGGVPDNATEIDHLMSPALAVAFLEQVEELSGESLIETTD